MSIHCNAKKEDIAKTVLIPGDPLRAKYIAENFLEFPAQRYFMNSGSWQNWTTYFIFMAITVTYAFLIWYGYRHKWYTYSQKR